jgi:hypothetical protein
MRNTGATAQKANGKLRPLGISILRDRVCMTAAMLVLLPGGTGTHWKAPPLHGARQKRTSPPF